MVDMRELNQFAEYLPFKMEDISQLKDILQRGDYMTKLDCLLDYSSRSKIKDLFKIFLEGRNLSVHMSTIWPLTISKVTCPPRH